MVVSWLRANRSSGYLFSFNSNCIGKSIILTIDNEPCAAPGDVGWEPARGRGLLHALLQLLVLEHRWT